MIRASIIGASGYVGAELAALIERHPSFNLEGLYVSADSVDAYKPFSSLFGQYAYQIDRTLIPISESQIGKICAESDVIFLTVPPQTGIEWAAQAVHHNTMVFDFSGSSHVQDANAYKRYYGLDQKYPEVINQAVYGLAEWNHEAIADANIIAVPNSYATSALMAIKPIVEQDLLDTAVLPVINTTSGVSVVGRRASLTSSFCEVSLNPFGVLQHRQQPEIVEQLNQPVVFNPHLAAFKRGILSTTTVKLREDVTEPQVNAAFAHAYEGKQMVRLRQNWPSVNDVKGTPFVDLHWQYDAETGYLVIVSALDNLMKGSASQAIQCANIKYNFDVTKGLL